MQAVSNNEQLTEEGQDTAGLADQPDKADHGVHRQRNVGSVERLLSVAIGAVILYFLRRKLLVYLGAACAAGYLLYRGGTGRCLLYEALDIETKDFDVEHMPFSEFFTTLAEEGPDEKTNPDTMARNYIVDEIDETLTESFPASDPPANW
jgi:hypothetical protein